MEIDYSKNADRFTGFADTYEDARPKMPFYVVEVIKKYLNASPDVVVDMGCGTGLSTMVWQGNCNRAIGIEPSDDMLKVALEKQIKDISFIKALSHDTGLADNLADAVICSQSFHWMEPFQTLKEVDRILKQNGIFATVDCDWPPVCNWEAEFAYNELFKEVDAVTENNDNLKESFNRWEKNKHLSNMKKSGVFRFVREIVFSNREQCSSERFINLAMSQGGLQTILKRKPEAILPQVQAFEEKIKNIFGEDSFDIDFCYRMRVGVK